MDVTGVVIMWLEASRYMDATGIVLGEGTRPLHVDMFTDPLGQGRNGQVRKTWCLLQDDFGDIARLNLFVERCDTTIFVDNC